MIDYNMNKIQLRRVAKISTNVISKLGRNEPVSIETLTKICAVLKCDVEDIMEINAIDTEEKNEKNL
jgi:DNA (cytosine-5)-methyltransferase 1